ncbi:hypothetical protein Tco_0222881 [Tanacetum coccineum]
MPDCILNPPTNESVITYTHLSGIHGVDTQSHVLPTIQSQFSDINLSFVSQQATASQVIDDVMRQLSFAETELDGEAAFADVTGSGMDSSGLSHDESFGVDDLDLNLNEEPDEPILAEVSTQEPIVAEVSTQEPIMAEVSTEAPIVEEVGTQEFSVEDVVIEDYVSSGEDGEDAEQGNGQEDESAPTDGQFFYDDEGIDTAYETEYDVQSSEDAGTDDDDDVDEDFLVDEENEIVEPDVDVHLFGVNMDLPFDNIGITNLVSNDVLEGKDVDVINADGFDSNPGNDEERNYRKRRLAELRTEMEGVINATSQWKYSFYTGQKFTTPKEAKDRVYLHFIESRRNLKLYKNDSVRIRARCEGKVLVFTMSYGTGPISLNRGMEAPPSGSSGPTTRSKKGRVQSTNPNTTVKIVVERNNDPSFPTRVFQRIYVCLGALKLGFRACKRDMLGLDGAFMKGPFPGQVLVAIGLDSNNGIYPLAYALVEAKTKSSWCWFLQCLGDDIDLHPNSNFTFISDRQKRAASATNVRDFEKCMLELKTMNPKEHEWLNKIPAEHWARSHFSGRAKSDLLLNNICEVFNGKIVGGKDKPVITLLEYIGEYCMKRIVNVQGVIDKCTGPLTPTASRIMESIKKEAHLMKVKWNGANKYQVSGSLGDQCVVDVVSMTCSCRKWELTGIPYKHAVAACWNMDVNDRATPPLETWVNPCYWLSTWKETYSHKIQPICRTKYWEKSTCPTTLLPPKHHVQVGRPKKKRKRSKHEDEPFVKDGGNNAEGSSSASRQAQQTKHAVGQDGSDGSGAGVVIGLSAAAGEGGAGDPGGAGVASKVSSHTRWTRRRVQTERISPQKRTPTQPTSQPYTSSEVPVSQTRNADGREMGDGVPIQSSAAGGASEWSFL